MVDSEKIVKLILRISYLLIGKLNINLKKKHVEGSHKFRSYFTKIH